MNLITLPKPFTTEDAEEKSTTETRRHGGTEITRDFGRSRRSPIGGKVFLVEKKIFWMLFIVLGLIMDFTLPIWWSLALTLPLAILCWWVAYRSGWLS